MRKSNRPLIVLAHPSLSETLSSLLPLELKQELRKNARIQTAKNRAELIQLIPKAQGLITRLRDPVDEALLSKAPLLRAVGNFAVGIDNVDLNACRRHEVRVCNTPDVLTRATAELTLALLLAAARRVHEGEALCRSGKFKGWEPQMLLGLELQGRRAVLVGRGRIGRETSQLFEGIGLKVEWLTRHSSPSEIRSKLGRAQILSFHTPLTPETHHWLSSSRLKLLPSDAIVLNTTRGAVIDEGALTQALKARRIFAAGLDVYENEPKIPAALRALPNVVMLPHLGSATIHARTGMAALAVGGVLAILSGNGAPNEVKF